MNATQLAGLCCFAGAASACAFVLWRTRRLVWAGIGAVQLLFLLEVFAGSRHVALGAVSNWLRSVGRYDDRKHFQQWLLIGLAALTFTAIVLLVKWLRRFGSRALVAAIASAGILAMFAAEAISLHSWDAQLYRVEGPILLVGWCWIAASAVVAGCALSER